MSQFRQLSRFYDLSISVSTPKTGVRGFVKKKKTLDRRKRHKTQKHLFEKSHSNAQKQQQTRIFQIYYVSTKKLILI